MLLMPPLTAVPWQGGGALAIGFTGRCHQVRPPVQTADVHLP